METLEQTVSELGKRATTHIVFVRAQHRFMESRASSTKTVRRIDRLEINRKAKRYTSHTDESIRLLLYVSFPFIVCGAAVSTEAVLRVSYQPLAVFRVRPVTRCTSTMPGHTEAVLHVNYSPDGTMLASGGGDMTVR